MALPASPGSPANPGAFPVAGQSGAPGAPPPGPQSGATQPTPNRGLQAAALAKMQWAVKILTMALPDLGVETEPGKDVMKALQTLSKHIPPGSTSPGVDNAGLQQMMMQHKQDQPQNQLFRAMGAGGVPAVAGAQRAA